MLVGGEVVQSSSLRVKSEEVQRVGQSDSRARKRAAVLFYLLLELLLPLLKQAGQRPGLGNRRRQGHALSRQARAARRCR